MPPVLSIDAFAARLAEPTPLGDIGARGGVAAVVDLTGAPAGSPLGEDVVRTIPGVIIGLGDGSAAPAEAGWAVLTDVVVTKGELDRLVAAVEARPRAAAALALLLRASERLCIEDGLVAESAVYSMLQAGPEFADWRQSRPAVVPPRAKPGEAPLLVARDGDRLTVTLSRPAVHNALNTAMRDALVETLAIAVADRDVTVVLDGAGPSFCSGGDLGDFGTAPDPATAHLVRLTRSPAALAARLGPRLLAQVHGACIGAGMELAAFAGRVVARPETFFALPELSFGLVPGSGGTVSLPRRIGRHRTAWLALTGDRIDAERARRWGLVDDIA